MNTRYLFPILFLAGTMLVGCHSPSMVQTKTPKPIVATPAPFHSMFITTRGSHTSADGIWRVEVSAAGNSLDLSHHETSKGEGSTRAGWDTVRVPGWTAKSGWFVFIESESKVWAYDGERQLCLDTVKPGSGAFYHGPRAFPCAVPAQVFSRLSKPAQMAIEKHE